MRGAIKSRLKSDRTFLGSDHEVLAGTATECRAVTASHATADSRKRCTAAGDGTRSVPTTLLTPERRGRQSLQRLRQFFRDRFQADERGLAGEVFADVEGGLAGDRLFAGEKACE